MATDNFQPAADPTEAELLARHDVISKQRPVLPHQAGKAYVVIQGIVASSAARRPQTQARQAQARSLTKTRLKRSEHDITVKSVVNPKIDRQKLVKAILAIVRAETAAEIKRRQEPPPAS